LIGGVAIAASLFYIYTNRAYDKSSRKLGATHLLNNAKEGIQGIESKKVENELRNILFD